MNDLREIRIGVLGGGISAERDISLISSRQVYKDLSDKGLNIVFIDIVTKEKGKIKELIHNLNIDLAFIALHGEFGEDGQIQEILEELGIVYTGSEPRASALAMNKFNSKNLFKAKGIPTPDFVVLSKGEDIPSGLRYPLVVKPFSSGSSIGISIVENKDNLRSALELGFLHSDSVILEDYIEGRELTVGILGDQPLAVVEIIPKEGYFDFEAKYSNGGSSFIAPAQIDDEVEKNIRAVVLAAHSILGCRHFSRVDMRLSKEGLPFILEVNSIPGLTSHSLFPLSAKAWGINFNQLIIKMMELTLYGKKET
ncbi:MAG: D-alanine--D-alanine ligase [Candidatus Omnitrophica bacterium]|nr:D-alanine--D-alanine ligase [Candidatus Omnitrophota bacterium]